MSQYTLYFNPLVQQYAANSPDPFYAASTDVSNPSCQFFLDKKTTKSISLDAADTYVFTPSDLATDDGSVIIARVVGTARIKTTGVDSDLSTPITGYLPAYGTAIFPGYILLSTFNVSAFEILGQADDTTVDLFYGSKEGIDVSNIGLTTQASRAYASALSLSTGTAANVANSPGTSIVLDAGSYEVRACAHFQPSGAVVTRFNVCVSTTSATEAATSTIALPSSTGEVTAKIQAGSAFSNVEITIPIPAYVLVVPVNTTATLFLVGTATFGSGTCSVSGWIEARKVL